MSAGATSSVIVLFIAIGAHPLDLVGISLARHTECSACSANGPFLVTFDVPTSASAAASEDMGSARSRSLRGHHSECHTIKCCLIDRELLERVNAILCLKHEIWRASPRKCRSRLPGDNPATLIALSPLGNACSFRLPQFRRLMRISVHSHFIAPWPQPQSVFALNALALVY